MYDINSNTHARNVNREIAGVYPALPGGTGGPTGPTSAGGGFRSRGRPRLPRWPNSGIFGMTEAQSTQLKRLKEDAIRLLRDLEYMGSVREPTTWVQTRHAGSAFMYQPGIRAFGKGLKHRLGPTLGVATSRCFFHFHLASLLDRDGNLIEACITEYRRRMSVPVILVTDHDLYERGDEVFGL